MTAPKITFKEIIKSMPIRNESADPLDTLKGSSLIKVPFNLWKEKMLFYGGCDKTLKQLTGSFPATFRKHKTTHPVLLLKKTSNLSFTACPCTSQPHKRFSYIKSHCPLDLTGKTLSRNCYILKRYKFNLSPDPKFNKRLTLAGIVPEHCLSKP
jgi:hypothetical protein